LSEAENQGGSVVINVQERHRFASESQKSGVCQFHELEDVVDVVQEVHRAFGVVSFGIAENLSRKEQEQKRAGAEKSRSRKEEKRKTRDETSHRVDPRKTQRQTAYIKERCPLDHGYQLSGLGERMRRREEKMRRRQEKRREE
jgi:hypothetical protein